MPNCVSQITKISQIPQKDRYTDRVTSWWAHVGAKKHKTFEIEIIFHYICLSCHLKTRIDCLIDSIYYLKFTGASARGYHHQGHHSSSLDTRHQEPDTMTNCWSSNRLSVDWGLHGEKNCASTLFWFVLCVGKFNFINLWNRDRINWISALGFRLVKYCSLNIFGHLTNQMYFCERW